MKLGVPWVIIVNGQDILPVTCGWAILLKIFIENLNKTYGKPISSEELDKIIDKTVLEMSKLFPKAENHVFKDDLKDIIETLESIAKGEAPNLNIGYVVLREYAKYIQTPHRMDLMISSMCEKGHWHCNQKCIHCYAGEQEYAIKDELSTSEWKHIIDECRKACIPQLTFTGGEPTLHNELPEVIKQIKEFGFIIKLDTNGTNPKMLKDLIDNQDNPHHNRQ